MGSYIAVGSATSEAFDKVYLSHVSKLKVNADPLKAKESFLYQARGFSKTGPVPDKAVPAMVKTVTALILREIKNIGSLIGVSGWENDPNTVGAVISNLTKVQGAILAVEDAVIASSRMPADLVDGYNSAVDAYLATLKEAYVEKAVTSARKFDIVASIAAPGVKPYSGQTETGGSKLLPIAAVAAIAYFAMKG